MSAPEQPLPDIGAQLAAIEAGLKQLLSMGLNRRAIVVLLNDSTGVGVRDIQKVLTGLEELRANYTTRRAGK